MKIETETNKLRVVREMRVEAGEACTHSASRGTIEECGRRFMQIDADTDFTTETLRTLRDDEQDEQMEGVIRRGEQLFQRGRGSKLSNLSEEQRLKLDSWLHEERLPYRKVQQSLKDEFGMSLSLGALSKHAKRAERWVADLDELKSIASQMEGVFKELGCAEHMEGMMKLIGMNGIRLALSEPESLKEQMRVARILMQYQSRLQSKASGACIHNASGNCVSEQGEQGEALHQSRVDKLEMEVLKVIGSRKYTFEKFALVRQAIRHVLTSKVGGILEGQNVVADMVLRLMGNPIVKNESGIVPMLMQAIECAKQGADCDNHEAKTGGACTHGAARDCGNEQGEQSEQDANGRGFLRKVTKEAKEDVLGSEDVKEAKLGIEGNEQGEQQGEALTQCASRGETETEFNNQETKAGGACTQSSSSEEGEESQNEQGEQSEQSPKDGWSRKGGRKPYALSKVMKVYGSGIREIINPIPEASGHSGLLFGF